MIRRFPRREIIAAVLLAAASVWALPRVLPLFLLINATIYVAMAVLALSLAFVWGFGGILCFGQTAFFGLGGYSYAVAALNLTGTSVAAAIAVAVAAAFAALLGYLMFFGRVGNLYVGVITFAVTLILFNFANSTAGPQWHIGAAALGGFNGIPATPPLSMPGQPGSPLAPEQIFGVAAACLAACYVICKLVLRSRFGRAAVAVKENETRAGLLGYDVRLYKLGVFTIGGAIAGLAGMLFANCVFVSPSMFSLFYAAQVIIWVMVGGLGTLVGPVVGAIVLQMLTAWAGTLPDVSPNFILGLILMAAVLIIPRGILPAVSGALSGAVARLGLRSAGR